MWGEGQWTREGKSALTLKKRGEVMETSWRWCGEFLHGKGSILGGWSQGKARRQEWPVGRYD